MIDTIISFTAALPSQGRIQEIIRGKFLINWDKMGVDLQKGVVREAWKIWN